MNTKEIVRKHYQRYYPFSKRKLTDKRIQQDWAGMYRWTMDCDPCQIGSNEYYFWSYTSFSEYLKLFREVEAEELPKHKIPA